MKKITLQNYAADRYYPKIVAAVDARLQSTGFVSPIDVLVSMLLLDRRHVEDWRRGRVPYLEKAITCNLAKAGRILRILRFHAHDLNLLPRATDYRRWGRGPKVRLRFSKSGDHKIEEAYARHFVKPVRRRKAKELGGSETRCRPLPEPESDHAADTEVSPTDAATILGMSRPLVVHRMDVGDLPFRYVGKHRRSRLNDVLALKARIDEQRAALDALTEDTEALAHDHCL
jgi:hypothetical protein